MKRILTLFVALSLLSCAKPIVKNPAFSTVKTLAIISLYTNHDIYDVKEASSNANFITALKKATGGDQTLADERVQLATASLVSFTEEMDKLSDWSLTPTPDILSNEKYVEFIEETGQGGVLWGAATANYVTPPGMALVPFTSVVGEKGKTTMVNGENPVVTTQKRLAQLATDMGVDAVAVVDIDLAYKRGALSGMSGTGLLSNIRGKAKPSVSAAMVVVTKDGSIALQTPHIQRGGGTRYETNSAPMLLKGKIDLTGEKGLESIQMFNVAVQLCAAGLREQIGTELIELSGG